MKDLNFISALNALGQGIHVKRKNWGKGVFLYLVKESLVDHDDFRDDTKKAVTHRGLIEGDGVLTPSKRIVNRHIDLMCQDGSINVGWSPSQLDMAAQDWEVLPLEVIK